MSWLKAIAKYQGTSSGGPNFAFSHCVNKFSEDELKGVDLSSWKVAYCGSEPIRDEVIKGFIEKFEPYGFNPNAFFPTYGMAEHTLCTTAPTLGKRYRLLRVNAKKIENNDVVRAE